MVVRLHAGTHDKVIAEPYLAAPRGRLGRLLRAASANASLTAAGCGVAAVGLPRVHNGPRVVAMEKRRLGRLGHQSSVLVYGAAALSDVSQDVADQSIQEALDGGINHVDVAADYGDAELRLGPWMSDIRDRVFLATKTGQRDRESAWRQIHASLARLQTDHVDLLQLHAVGDLGELDTATGPDGALEAAIRAEEEGVVGAIGITGHGHAAPATHLEALRRHPFATVLTPLNPVLWRDESYRTAYQALVEEVRRQDAGLMTIKTASRRNWPQRAEPAYSTWYEPYVDQARVTAAVSWVLSHGEVTGIPTPGDVRLLPLLLEAERNRVSPAEAELRLQGDGDYSSPFLAMPF
jgi:aryl-alcohol dehydrogenase-like predicted oxidoreductase